MNVRDDPREYVLRTAKENDVKFIRMWFTDILGHLKGFAITVAELEGALERGMSFDASWACCSCFWIIESLSPVHWPERALHGRLGACTNLWRIGSCETA